LGERVELVVVFGDFTRQLDDKNIFLEPLNVWQRFTQ
jgi:hypothetical protein